MGIKPLLASQHTAGTFHISQIIHSVTNSVTLIIRNLKRMGGNSNLPLHLLLTYLWEKVGTMSNLLEILVPLS